MAIMDSEIQLSFGDKNRIKAGSVTNIKLNEMPAFTVKGNNTDQEATPVDVAIPDLITMIRAVEPLVILNMSGAMFGNMTTVGNTIEQSTAIPSSKEGIEVLNFPYRPKSATSMMKVEVNVMVSAKNKSTATVSLFKDDDSLALAVGSAGIADDLPHMVSFFGLVKSFSTNRIIFKVRVAGNGSNNLLTVNGKKGQGLFSDLAASGIFVTEYAG